MESQAYDIDWTSIPGKSVLQYYVLGVAGICHISSSRFYLQEYAYELLEMEVIYTGFQ